MKHITFQDSWQKTWQDSYIYDQMEITEDHLANVYSSVKEEIILRKRLKS